MAKILFATVNSFLGLPPVKEMLAHLVKNNEICVFQCDINSFENFVVDVGIKQTVVLNFKSSLDFNSQSTWNKVLKYLKITFLIIKEKILKKNTFSKFFTTDLYTLLLAIIFKGKKDTIVYLQYEMIEASKLNFFDKYIFKVIQKFCSQVDLIVTPEENRTKYLRSLLPKSKDNQFYTLPNTNNNCQYITNVEVNTNHPKVITHIGAIGMSHHIKSYLDSITMLNESDYEFRFIGLLTNDVIDLINSYGRTNIKCIGQVKHSELEKFYLDTDVGVILYKDISLNHRFCAPNKLYEYWSFGIPVIGDLLPGLKSVYINNVLGQLVDMAKPNDIMQCLKMLTEKHKKKQIQTFFIENMKLSLYLNEFEKRLNLV